MATAVLELEFTWHIIAQMEIMLVWCVVLNHQSLKLYLSLSECREQYNVLLYSAVPHSKQLRARLLFASSDTNVHWSDLLI